MSATEPSNLATMRARRKRRAHERSYKDASSAANLSGVPTSVQLPR